MALSSYLVTCITEGTRIMSDFRLTPPTTCPNDTSHTIDPTQTVIYQSQTVKQTTLNQGNDSTCQNYQAHGFPFQTITAGPNVVTTINYTLPYKMIPRLFTFMPSDTNIGDTFSILATPNTVIGTLTQNANIGDTTLTVNQTVLNYLHNGFAITITNGVNTDDCDICMSIDTGSNTIIVKNALNHAYSAGAYVQMTVQRVTNIPIVNTNNILIGLNNLTSSVVPANILIQVLYTNNSNITKSANFIMEYLY